MGKVCEMKEKWRGKQGNNEMGREGKIGGKR